VIEVQIDDRQVVVDKQLTDLFNELIGANLNTVEDVKNAIRETKRAIAQARRSLRKAGYLKKLISSTVVPMCGDIGLKDEASDLLDKVERAELDLRDFLAHAEGKLDWLYGELEKVKKKEEQERKGRLYRYMKEHLS